MKTQQTAQPTPTPWTEMTQPRGNDRTLRINTISGPEGECIAYLDSGSADNKGNAAFIVRAVNSFEALLEAAKEADAFINGSGAYRLKHEKRIADFIGKAIAQAEDHAGDIKEKVS